MVAIKAADKRLTARDIWPGLPWEWEDVIRIKNECRQRAINAGITDELKLTFAESHEWEKYIQSFPTHSERQKIISRIYPHVPTPKSDLTDEEKQYIIERLFGSNDEVGQNILKKLQLTLSTK